MCEKNEVRKFMCREIRKYTSEYDLWESVDEVNCTKLTEHAALHFDHLEWLDDETHWVWDLATDIAADAEVARENASKRDHRW